MQQIETESKTKSGSKIEGTLNVHLETTSNIPASGVTGKSQDPSASVPRTSPSYPTHPQEKTLAHWLQRSFTLAIAIAASTTLGLGAALLIPLPMGLVAKDKISKSLGLWQVGLGYHVGRPVNVLVMGIDRVPGAKDDSKEIFSGRSDTMLLVRVDPIADTVSLLSIPRDTQVDIPNVGVTKINDANVRGGATLAAQTVSANLNGVQIDRYVRVSTDAFKELVNLLGGVEVYVPKPMKYEDKTQKLKIDLSPGRQILNGDQAEQFARFRHDDLGDIGRVQRQQTLLKALRKQVTSPSIIPRIPSLVKAMQKYIDTNLSLEEMLALVGAGRKLSEGKFKMVMLPGRFSSPNEFIASYWLMDSLGRDRVMQQYFDVNPIDLTADASVAATSLRISLQNASGDPNAAYEMRRFLSKLGFNDVVISYDLPNRQSQTQVIPQQGDFHGAEDIQRVLGLGIVEAESTGDLESDITIQVGEDWAKRNK